MKTLLPIEGNTKRFHVSRFIALVVQLKFLPTHYFEQ